MTLVQELVVVVGVTLESGPFDGEGNDLRCVLLCRQILFEESSDSRPTDLFDEGVRESTEFPPKGTEQVDKQTDPFRKHFFDFRLPESHVKGQMVLRPEGDAGCIQQSDVSSQGAPDFLRDRCEPFCRIAFKKHHPITD